MESMLHDACFEPASIVAEMHRRFVYSIRYYLGLLPGAQ